MKAGLTQKNKLFKTAALQKKINHQSKNELFNQTKSKKEIMNIETKARCVGVLEFCILSVLKKRCIHIGNIRHIKKKVISSWKNHLSFTND
jgi:hypothetical protein